MADAGQRWAWTVRPGARRGEEWQAFAELVRAQEPGVYLDAAAVTGQTLSEDAAKSLTWRINHGKSAAFRPTGHFFAKTEGNQVSVTYRGPAPATQSSSRLPA